MSSDTVISIQGVGKCYQMYDKPHERLLQMLVRGRKRYYREFWALRDFSLEIAKGDVIGIVGSNGAGKSTLLQLVCGTLHPTTGRIAVNGRVAALLELGAGFNPEFSGRENIYLNAAVMGLSREEIDSRYEDIVTFSGIRDFIDQPVKTYSSGMYVRLAFSIAINVDPDILIIDEALSVGDGEFARKSFDRIMGMKDAGKTILFCSHALYQVEAICNRVVWLDKGAVAAQGEPAEVLAAYRQALELATMNSRSPAPGQRREAAQAVSQPGCAGIDRVTVAGTPPGECALIRSGEDDLRVVVTFTADPALPPPALVFEVFTESGQTVSSGGSRFDGFDVALNERGRGEVELCFPKIPLMRGRYTMNIYLTCEQMLHVYDQVQAAVTFTIYQPNIEKGLVFLSHTWSAGGRSQRKEAVRG